MNRSLAGLAALAATTLWGAPAALAHAYPDHSSPPADSMLSTPPAAVSIWFTQSLEPKYSGIEVIDAGGKPVENGRPAVDPNNPALLRVGLKTLLPGHYTVNWHVTSVDTHATQGSFGFTVVKP